MTNKEIIKNLLIIKDSIEDCRNYSKFLVDDIIDEILDRMENK